MWLATGFYICLSHFLCLYCSTSVLVVANINNNPLIWLRHPLDLTSIWYKHMYTSIYNKQPVTQDSNNNRIWHMEVGRQKQTVPSLANNPIRSGLNLASTHQMAPRKHISDYSIADLLPSPAWACLSVYLTHRCVHLVFCPNTCSFRIWIISITLCFIVKF